MAGMPDSQGFARLRPLSPAGGRHLDRDAAAKIDELRRIIDANYDEQADLFCSQPVNS